MQWQRMSGFWVDKKGKQSLSPLHSACQFERGTYCEARNLFNAGGERKTQWDGRKQKNSFFTDGPGKVQETIMRQKKDLT